MKDRLSRRGFLAATGAAMALSATGAETPAAPEAKASVSTPPIVVFSKHLQHLGYAALAMQCKKLGLDGADLTVRSGGHVEPDKVAEDLPRAVEAIREQGLEVPMITTSLNRGDDPDAERILKTAGELGIKYFRIGGHKYSAMGNPLPRLDAVAKDLKSLAAVAEAHGMVAGYHNHSGENNVGAPVWDLHYVFNKVNSPSIGANFDVGHATVEGSYGDWSITARLMAKHVNMMAVKDFIWRKDRPRWVQLGEGIVQTTAFLEVFRRVGFAGPISLHFEYPTRSKGELAQHIEEGAAHVRTCLEEAGYDA